jgi:hypothetical protein
MDMDTDQLHQQTKSPTQGRTQSSTKDKDNSSSQEKLSYFRTLCSNLSVVHNFINYIYNEKISKINRETIYYFQTKTL